jgi:hypothetical protein
VHGRQLHRVGVADPAPLQPELLCLGGGEVGQERAERWLFLVAGERGRRVRERVEVGVGACRVGAGPRGHLDVQAQRALHLADEFRQGPGRVLAQRP